MRIHIGTYLPAVVMAIILLLLPSGDVYAEIAEEEVIAEEVCGIAVASMSVPAATHIAADKQNPDKKRAAFCEKGSVAQPRLVFLPDCQKRFCVFRE